MKRLLLVLLAICPAVADGQEWSRFRGPNSSGLGPTVKFSADPKPIWKVKLPGEGHSSPVLWGRCLFATSGNETGTRIVQCFDASKGKELWRRDFAGKKHLMHKDNSFASSTPAVGPKHLILCWAKPAELLVQALDHDGKELWKTDLGPYRAGHGFGASPIIHDDVVIVPNDQDGDSKLFGIDLATGKVRWQLARKARSQYATPCMYQPPNQPAQVLIASYELGITSIDPPTGKINWELDIFDKKHMECSIASPFVAGDRIIASSGYLGVRQEVVALQLEAGKPRPTDPVLYRLDKGTPLVPTPLVKDDLLFVWNDRGVVSCVDLATGKEHWRERIPGSYYSSPVCAGRTLFNVSREGDLVVLAADKKFAILGTHPLGEGSHGTPALAGGKLFVRTFRHLMCFGD